MSREYTEEEVRELFLKRIWVLIDYWNSNEYTKQHALEGLAFTILAELDGESDGSIPPFLVITNPHPDDKMYYVDIGQNYFPEYDPEMELQCDIGGSLHEKFYEVGRNR